MKYLCLVYLEEKMVEALPKAERDEWKGEDLAYAEELRMSGHLIAVQSLQSVRTSATLRARNGNVSLTGGPFAETREQLAGFLLIEARDLNEAIHAASRIPGARYGSVELRPILEFPEAAAR